MKILEYYILVNTYIMFFWIFFRIILKNEPIFQSIRFYLLASLLISILLPFLHISYQSFPIIYSHISEDLGFSENINALPEYLLKKTGSVTGINYDPLFKSIIITGSFFFLLLSVFSHFKIHSLIKKSGGISYKNISVKIISQPIIPLLYNRSILIPDTISQEEMGIIIEHEYQHFQLGHYIDNFLLQLLQIMFWINPFIYLIMRDLKQIHEYQVDKEIINSGIDASIYKLTLIKYSVGFQKFAIANGLSNYQIKNRLIMMSKMNVRKWKWKFLLFFPAFFVVFFLLSLTSSNKSTLLFNHEQRIVEDRKIEITAISNEELAAMRANNSDFIILMINHKSQLLLNGNEKPSLNEVVEKVNNSFKTKVSEVHEELNSGILSNASPKIEFVIQKSTYTDPNDYEKLLDNLSKSIFSLQEMYSNELFGKSYNQLDSTDKDVLKNLVQPRIYTLPDKKTGFRGTIPKNVQGV
jgi:hypothetical protein